MKLRNSCQWIFRGVLCFSLLLGFTNRAAAEDTISQMFTTALAVEGITLKKIGSGIREFLFFDIYALGAYSASGSCDPADIIYRNEQKYLRLVMIRNISRKRMVSTLSKTLNENLSETSSRETKQNIELFLAQFKKDLSEGTVVEIIYQPDNGVLVKQGGHNLGPYTKGKEFAETLWRSYFGSETCCPRLKSDILKQCSKIK